MERKNKSSVWKFFKKVDNNSKYVKCEFCNQEYKHSGNTTNLRDHLKRKHNEKIGEIEERLCETSAGQREQEGSSSDSEQTQTKKSRNTIKNYFNRSQFYDGNSKIKKELDRRYAEMVAIDMLPYRTSEHMGLKKFVHALNSRYELPDRKTLKHSLIPKLYDELKNKLEVALSKCKFLSVTTDMWTNNANEGILALTAHFIVDEKLLSPILKVTKIEGHHNAETMARVSILSFKFLMSNM